MLKKIILTISLSLLVLADENASKEVIVKFIQSNASVVMINTPVSATSITSDDLETITSLYFSKIDFIPSEIKYLTNLRILSTEDNELETFPSEIGKLKNLEFLFSWNNKIKELPSEISNLENLQAIGLNNNEIINLPKGIGKLQKLEILSLDFNKITKIPKEMSNLKSLRELYLNDNQIEELPKEIGDLNKLEKLDLSNNRLKFIPKEIGNLESLKELYLNNNDLRELPKEIANFCTYFKDLRMPQPETLCHIDVSNNKLSYLPKEIEGIRVMGCMFEYENLKFENNYFDTIPLSFKKIRFGDVIPDYSGFYFWGCKNTNFETLGYSFFSLLIDYSFEDNKTISFKPILGDDFNITSYLWNFGDGNISIEKTPIHTYSNYSDYNVTLTLNSGEFNASKLISVYPRVLELKKGWNMITSPSKDDINATLFEIVWSYENEKWDNNHSFLKPTIGYWVKLNQDLNYSYNGEVYKLPNYKIKNGWNFLGSGGKYFIEENQTIYQFKNGEWLINPNEIKAGQGFWIKRNSGIE